MPSYYYGPEVHIRSSRPTKKYEFVRSKSFSYGHREHHDRHHHHRRLHVCPDNCAGVTYDEWDAILRENRKITARYDNTIRENQTLKSDLQAASALSQQLSGENQQLRHSLSHDDRDNVDKFRRRVAAMKVELEKKDHTIYHLEKDNASLLSKVRELTPYDNLADKIAELTSEVAHWKQRAADTLDMAKRFETGYDRVLKDLDKKSDLIDQYRDKVRRLEGHIPRSGSFRVVHA